MDALWHMAWIGVLIGALGFDAWLLRTGRRGGVALLFALVAVLATWPLAVSLDRLPANAPAAHDAWLFLWDLWWVKTALAAGASPLHTEFLYAPHGTALVFHGLALPQALATLPLQGLREGLGGLLLAYGAVVLLSFWLAGLAAYGLARHVVRDEAVAVVCGLAFTLQGLHFASTVRFHALAIEWLPLTLWALLRVLERGRARDGLLFGLAWVGACYASVEYAYFLLLAGGIFVLCELARVRGRERARALGWWWRSALGLVPALLLTLPFWLALAAELRLSHGALGEHARHLTPDLLDVLLPDPRHSLLGAPLAALRARLGLVEIPTAVAIGWTLLALAAAGAARAWRRRAAELVPWAVLAVVFALLMLGPSLRLLGRDTGIPGPYAALAGLLPFFEQARMPMRLGAVAQLGLAVLAAYGLQGLAGRLAPPRRRLAVLVAGALVGFEALRVPLAMAPVRVPEAYARVAASARPGEAALLDWPPGLGASAQIEGLHQVVHQQRLVQDLPMFLPRAALETRRTATGPELAGLVRTLFATDRLARAEGPARAALVAGARASLAALDLRHVVLRRRELPPEVYARGREHLRLLGPAEVFEDEDAFWARFEPARPAP